MEVARKVVEVVGRGVPGRRGGWAWWAAVGAAGLAGVAAAVAAAAAVTWRMRVGLVGRRRVAVDGLGVIEAWYAAGPTSRNVFYTVVARDAPAWRAVAAARSCAAVSVNSRDLVSS